MIAIIMMIAGGIMMVLGGITAVVTLIFGADIYTSWNPQMSANILEMLTIPFQWLFVTLTSEVHKNQVGLIWYGLLLVIAGLVLYLKGGRRTKSMLASAVSFLFHAFLVTGLTGVVFHLFTDYRPMTVADIASHYSDKLILWPWDVISALENAFIQHRGLLLIAAAVTLVVYILARVADEYSDMGYDPVTQVISYAVPVVFTILAGILIVKNVLGYDNWGQIIKDHPFFQASESRADFPYYRIVSVFLLCAVSSLCLMRSWYRYTSSGSWGVVGSIVVMAVLLLAAVGLVLMLSDAVALLLTSVVSTLIAIVAAVIFCYIARAGIAVGKIETEYIRQKNRYGRITSQEAGRALLFMDEDDPDQLSMMHAFNNGDDEDEFDD